MRFTFICTLAALLTLTLDAHHLAPLALTALAAVTTACLVRALARPRAAAPQLALARTLRARAARTAFLPQRDPDGPGRTRPRAPGLPARAAA